MAIDINVERLITIAQASDLLPSKPHPGTIFRWWRFGVRGAKLETVTIGGKRFTSPEAVERFVTATTAMSNADPIPSRVPSRRAKEIAAADSRTALAGI